MHRAARFLKRGGFDGVLLNLNKDARVIGVAARLAGVRWVVARHGAKVLSDRWRDRLTAAILDGVIVNNRALLQTYRSYRWMNPDKVRLIHNGVAPPGPVVPLPVRRTLGLDGQTLLVAAAGRLSYEKGFDILIDAVAGRLAQRPVAVLVAGEGPQERRLRDRVRRLGLARYIHFLGFVEDTARLYAAADLVVLPSRYEGMPNALMEAMALGRPVVATRVNGVEELIPSEEEGWLVSPADPAALREGLDRALRSPAERRRRGARARERIARDFSLERMLDNLEGCLRQHHERTVATV